LTPKNVHGKVGDAWLCDFGLRVTDLAKSTEFYTKLLDLEELKRVESPESAYVLFRDRRSGQRIELNWYAKTSPFATPYEPGEGLDHIEVRVRDLPEMLVKLAASGIHPATRKFGATAVALGMKKSHPGEYDWLDLDVWTTDSGHRIAYIQDPDGNFLCLYDHPEEKWEGPIPDHY
jgi:catechol 2,3-dioxygenase-like lactoylglutathione lyase family enzyme